MFYTFLLVMTHPVENFTRNVDVMAKSQTCAQHMAYNATKEVVNAAMAPVKSILGDIRDVLASLVVLAERLREGFQKVRDVFEEIIDGVQSVTSWVGSMVNVCNDKMGAPYKKCKKVFEDAEVNCRRDASIFGGLCDMVGWVEPVCNIARIGELLCYIVAAVKNLILSSVKFDLDVVLQNIHDMFYFNVSLEYHYNLTVVQTKTFEEVAQDIRNEIQACLKPFYVVINWSSVGLLVMTSLLLFKSLIYRRKYSKYDEYDNLYLSHHLEDIDERREEMGKETILPLEWLEQKRYVKTISPKMTSVELRKLVTGIVLFVGTLFHALFYLACDYGLYWLLNMITTKAQFDAGLGETGGVKMHVKGRGVLSDMYRALITTFDPMEKKEHDDLDFSRCLPHPIEPNLTMYKVIGIMFSVCLVLIFTEAYGLRTRHVIMSAYQPRREKERALWLYNNILRRRGGLLKHLRRMLREKYDTAEADKAQDEEFSAKSRVAAVCPALARKLGFKQKYCLSCSTPGEPDDMEKFVHCSTPDCNAVYCQDCFTDINNMCTVCMNPVDYGDLSDFSEERDSSDESLTEVESSTTVVSQDDMMAFMTRMQQRQQAAEPYSYQDLKELDAGPTSSDDETYSSRPKVDLSTMDIFQGDSDADSSGESGMSARSGSASSSEEDEAELDISPDTSLLSAGSRGSASASQRFKQVI